MFVSEFTGHRVVQISASGSIVATWGTYGSGSGQLNGPWGFCAYDDILYIADYGNSRIQKFGVTSGEFLGSITHATIVNPSSVYATADYLYVTCPASNPGIFYFLLDGTYQGTFDDVPGSDGQQPVDITSLGTSIYVCYQDYVVAEFSATGSLITSQGIAFQCQGIATNGGSFFLSGYEIVGESHGVREYDLDLAFIREWYTGPHTTTLQIAINTGKDPDELLVADIGTNGILTNSQTTFYAYTSPTERVALGTPDGGVAIPSLNALSPEENNAGFYARHITDIRTRIQALAPYFVNVATGNPFNWTASSADNLYFVAMGDRTKYGATGGAAYTWTRTEEEMIGTAMYDLDIGELKECLDKLASSSIVS